MILDYKAVSNHPKRSGTEKTAEICVAKRGRPIGSWKYKSENANIYDI